MAKGGVSGRKPVVTEALHAKEKGTLLAQRPLFDFFSYG